jgi:hypothetical protein
MTVISESASRVKLGWVHALEGYKRQQREERSNEELTVLE